MIDLPNIDMEMTGQNIIRLREAVGLSVRDLQGMFGFSTPQAIYKWQHGTALPTVDNLVALSSILGVSIEDILAVQETCGDIFFIFLHTRKACNGGVTIYNYHIQVILF